MITVYYNYYNPQQNGKQVISNWGSIRHSEVLSILHGESCSVIPLKHNEPQVLGKPRGFHRNPIHLLFVVSCTDWNLHLLGGVNVHGHTPENYVVRYLMLYQPSPPCNLPITFTINNYYVVVARFGQGRRRQFCKS